MIRIVEHPGFLAGTVMLSLAAGLWWMMWAHMGNAASMPDMNMMVNWSAKSLTGTSIMWLFMMLAMMLPAMVPMVATYTLISRNEVRGAALALRVIVFTAGYFSLWAAFSVAAAFAQTALAHTPWFEMGGTQALPAASAVLLIAAGMWQLTPIKDTCLQHCRSPMTFLMAHWKGGLKGAFPVGLHHGAYCVGCCGMIMGLMFVFGAMTVWWMAVLTGYFVAEKIIPRVETWGRITGIVLIGAGLYVFANTLWS
jgi:predicted metal-binding membrane protein